MKLSIVTPKGISFDGEVDYIVIDGDNGQLANFTKPYTNCGVY